MEFCRNTTLAYSNFGKYKKTETISFAETSFAVTVSQIWAAVPKHFMELLLARY